MTDKITTFTTEETRFLSNFYPHKRDGKKYPLRISIFFEGLLFDCVECAYQAAKTSDQQLRERISRMSPYEAKAFADSELIPDPSWFERRDSVMEDLVRQKFTAHEEIGRMLLATGDAELIEGNDWQDVYWGVCDNRGENRLGRILMKIRAELREKKSR